MKYQLDQGLPGVQIKLQVSSSCLDYIRPHVLTMMSDHFYPRISQGRQSVPICKTMIWRDYQGYGPQATKCHGILQC
eukprot:9899697-Ditylum_brightwellii.AAC.1